MVSVRSTDCQRCHSQQSLGQETCPCRSLARVQSALRPCRRPRRLHVSLTVDFDAVAGFLGTGYDPRNNLADLSTGAFSANVGVGRLLKLFDKHAVADRVSWFIPGHTAESFPEEAARIAQTGCEIGLHGYSHENCASMTPEQERDVLENCIRIIQELSGRPPSGYRAPLYSVRQHTLDLLRQYGFLYDSSMNAHDSRPYFLPDPINLVPVVPDYSKPAASWMHPLPQPQPVDPARSLIELPASYYTEDMTPLAFYPYQANSQGYVSTDVVEKMWWDRFLWLWENECEVHPGDLFGSWFSTIWHPESSGRTHIMPMIERFLARLIHFSQYEAHRGEITFETMEEVAKEFRATEMAKASKRRKVKATDSTATATSTLPTPWTGRLGYACLNTYLRSAQPSVFCSRTCRISSILEHRHPLQDPSSPEHATKNRPDRTKPPDVRLGQRYLEQLGRANAGDLSTLLRWNERYGIRFLRISSDMFPLASHAEYGYSLDFAAPELAAAGRIAARFGHRLTMHPGQYTQLGSLNDLVVDASVRDLAYHSELLQRLQLPPALDRDAVVILHMGGVFGDKAATLDRFKAVFQQRLTPDVRARLVLENDDVAWSVADLLPLCEELGIPLVLDYHHHSIVGGETDVGLASVAASAPLAARIRATWSARGITPKMHYSEPHYQGDHVTARDRRKHSARVGRLPPCPADADLMIEAKDKEQAVFALMRQYQLPGHERIGDIVPHERTDEGEDVPPDDVHMGGPDGRVFWPEGREDWLKHNKKRKGRKAAAEAQ